MAENMVASMAGNVSDDGMTPEMRAYLHDHSFHDGDVAKWGERHCHSDYDRSERFIVRRPRPDSDGQCMIESIAPAPVFVDCHGHLSCAWTKLAYIEHADEDAETLGLGEYAVTDGCHQTVVRPEEHGWRIVDGIALR